jgi:hypothetical protein
MIFRFWLHTFGLIGSDEKSRAESRLSESCDVRVKKQQKRVDIFCTRAREIFAPAFYLKHVKIIA